MEKTVSLSPYDNLWALSLSTHPSLSKGHSQHFFPRSKARQPPTAFLPGAIPTVLSCQVAALCCVPHPPMGASRQPDPSWVPSPQHTTKAQLACFATGTKTAKLTGNRDSSVPSYSLCHSPGGRRQWNERATHSKQGQAPAVWQLCFMSHSPFCWNPGHWSCLGQALDQLDGMKDLKSST